MKYAIGVDVGGTKISIVVGDASGRILASRQIPTQSRTRNAIPHMIQNLKTLAAAPRFKGEIRGIGLGVPGPINHESGVVPFSPNLRGWEGVPLKRMIQKALRLPVRMANDANTAVLGEKIFGQGRGKSDFIYITISTGIGGGIVSGGRLLEGTSFVAGEVGHMAVVAGGERCGCGRKGCLEAYASGTAIARYARKTLNQKEQRAVIKYSSDENLSARALGLAARGGNRAAVKVYERAGFYLGYGIANLLNILNPQSVLLGGGVFKSAPREFWQAMRASCRSQSWPQAFKAASIVRSKLKGRAGDLGALALVFENFR